MELRKWNLLISILCVLCAGVYTERSECVVNSPVFAQTAESDPFDILPAAPAQLVFTVSPTNTTVGYGFTPSVQVTIQDAYGNTCITATNTITLTGTGLTFGGTNPRNAINGIATFSDLTVGGISATSYTLTATSAGLTGTVSTAFALTGFGAAAQLLWVQQPTSPQTTGQSFSPAPSIRATDVYSNTITTYSSAITIERVSGTGTFSGATASAVGGLATFSSLQYNTAEALTIRGISGTLTPTTNVNITINSSTISGSWTETTFTTGTFNQTTGGADVVLVKGPINPVVWATMAVAPGAIGIGGALCPGSGNFIYGFRGNLSTAFYRYSISGNSWATMTPAPADINNSSGLVYPGSGDFIYGFRGYATSTFYRYSISGNTWATMTPAPGTITYGSALVYPGTGDFIYGFKGNGLTDFYRYSISGNSWATMTPAPADIYSGGALVYPGSGDFIYGFRGYNFTNFFRYSISGNSWASMTAAPGTINSGGALVYPGSGDFIYGFRGNSTTDFYRYSISGNSWASMTAAPGTITYGAALAYPGTGDFIYGSQGGDTTAFYRCQVIGYQSPGTYTSASIAPPSGAISQWNVLTFTRTLPGSTTFTVDVLRASDNAVLATNVTSGTNLSAIQAVPIRLRANFGTSDTTVTPTLSDWSVSYTYVP